MLALLSNGTAVSVSLFKKLPFDPLQDFEPVSSPGFFDFVFSTGANSEYKTLGDFIAAAKAKPGALNVGTINIGSTENLSAELFKTAAGIDFTIIPFRGTPEAQISLLQGDIALLIDSYSSMKGNLADGKIYFEAADLPELGDFFTALPAPVVVDHMGRPDVGKPVDGPEFELFVKFMRQHPNVWSTVGCPERLSISGPLALNGEQNPYRDVVPFARRSVESFPDRVLWGTDGRIPISRITCPTTACWSTSSPTSRSRPACSASCWSTIRCGCTGRYWPEEA